MVTRGRDWGEEEVDEGSQKVQTSSYKINKDIKYNIKKIINTAVCCMWKLREYIVSVLILYLYEMMNVYKT